MSAPFDLALVVDDDPDIALAARLALRDLFGRVETLTSPDDLASVLKTESPDAILLDLNFERGATDGREGLDQLARIMALDPDAGRSRLPAPSRSPAPRDERPRARSRCFVPRAPSPSAAAARHDRAPAAIGDAVPRARRG